MKRFFSAIAVLVLAAAFAAAAYADYDFKEEIIEDNISYHKFEQYNDDTIIRYYTGYSGATMDEFNNPRYYYRITHDNVEKIDLGDLETVETPIDGTEYKVVYNKSEYKIVDGLGNIIIDTDVYSYMYPHDGVVTVCRDGKYGIITAEGEIIKPIETELYLSVKFNDYGLGVCSAGGKCALINAQLEFLSAYEFTEIKLFGEYAGAAKSVSGERKDELYALMDKTGTLRTPFRYEYFSKNGDNIYACYSYPKTGRLKPDFTEYADLLKYGYSIVGERLILSRYEESAGGYIKEDTKENAIADVNGNIISGWYKDISLADDRFILSRYKENAGEDKKEDEKEYAVADVNGNIISGWYKDIISTDNGVFKFNDNGKYGIMDKDTNIIIPAEYESISVLSFGRILCCRNGFTDVYDFDFNKITETDGIIIDCGYNNGFNHICRAWRDGKYAFVDKDGKRLTDYIYDSDSGCCDCIDGSVVYYSYNNGEYKYYDENMNEVNADEKLPYRTKTDIGNYSLLCQDQWHYAVADRNTQRVIISYGDGYDGIKHNEINNTLMFSRGGKVGVMDLEGNELFSFDSYKNNQFDYDGGFYRYVMSDGIHLFDCAGRDVFGKGYKNIERLDNGIVVVKEDDCLKAMRSETISIAYNTDIRTYINGAEIPCYKADGFNVIAADDLGGYGFDVVWNGDEHRLYITRNPEYYTINQVEIPEKGEKNTVYKDIVYSDIEVYYEGQKIKSYSADGKTFIDVCDMASDAVAVSRNGDRVYISVSGLENRLLNV